MHDRGHLLEDGPCLLGLSHWKMPRSTEKIGVFFCNNNLSICIFIFEGRTELCKSSSGPNISISDPRFCILKKTLNLACYFNHVFFPFFSIFRNTDWARRLPLLRQRKTRVSPMDFTIRISRDLKANHLQPMGKEHPPLTI